MRISIKIFAIVLLGVFIFISAKSINAIEGATSSNSARKIINRPLNTQLLNDRLQNNKDKKASMAAMRKEKLSEQRLKICELRAKNIGMHLKNMQARGIAIHKGHENIFKRVDKFYNEKLIPNGYVLDNYETLITEIEANKTQVLALHTALMESGKEFDCNSEDPKGQIEGFKTDIKALIEANKAYKDSIHTYVKSVKVLAEQARAERAKNVPTGASVSPEVSE